MNRAQRRRAMKDLTEEDFMSHIKNKLYIQLADKAEESEFATYFQIEITTLDGEKKNLYVANSALIEKLKEANGGNNT